MTVTHDGIYTSWHVCQTGICTGIHSTVTMYIPVYMICPYMELYYIVYIVHMCLSVCRCVQSVHVYIHTHTYIYSSTYIHLSYCVCIYTMYESWVCTFVHTHSHIHLSRTSSTVYTHRVISRYSDIYVLRIVYDTQSVCRCLCQTHVWHICLHIYMSIYIT